MKRILAFLILNIIILSSFAQDWRKGSYNYSPSENFLMVNIEGKYAFDQNADLNPFGAGFNAAYQYKTGRKKGLTTTAHGLGGSIGFYYHPGLSINHKAVGTTYELAFSEYKDYALLPVMLSYNFYITKKKMHYFLGLDAGVQLMFKERDIKYNEMITTYYNGENDIKLSRVLPSAKAYFGIMYELNQDFRIRGQVGYDYTLGYKFDGVTPFLYYDMKHNLKESAPTGERTAPAMMNISASIGLVYSL